MQPTHEAIRSFVETTLGFEIPGTSFQNPKGMTQAEFVGMSIYAKALINATKADQADLADNQVNYDAVTTLLNAAPWAVHPNHGLVLKEQIPVIEHDQANLRLIDQTSESLITLQGKANMGDLVRSDLAAFEKIHDQNYRRLAAEVITFNTEDHPGYEAAFKVQIAERPKLHIDLLSLNAITKARMSGKEDRKAAEFSAMQADPVLQQTIAEYDRLDAIQKKVVNTGLHMGPILTIEGHFASQKIGRSPDSVAWHDLTQLDGNRPEVGQCVQISYANGKGTVKGPSIGHEVAQVER